MERIEKIDISKIRGEYNERRTGGDYVFTEAGNDTIKSIRLVAEKLNEVIDHLNAQPTRMESVWVTPVEEEWPQIGDRYFYIHADGYCYEDTWDDANVDNAIKNFIGIFKTREEAEARKKAIEKLNKI